MRTSLAFLSVVSALSLATSAASAQSFLGNAARHTGERTVTVTGWGQVMAQPDQASITAGVESQAPTASEALERNNTQVELLISALTDAGVAREDIQTTEFSIMPVYAETPPGAAPVVNGYLVTNLVTFISRTKDATGALLDLLVSTGANRVHGVSFGFSSPRAHEEEARRVAMFDAQRTAGELAKLAGAELGPIVTIELASTSPMMGERSYAMAADVPIMPGQAAVSSMVMVTYALR